MAGEAGEGGEAAKKKIKRVCETRMPPAATKNKIG